MKGTESVVFRCALLILWAAVAGLVPACRSVSTGRSAQKDAEKLLEAGDYRQAAAAFHKAAALGETTPERCKALMGLAESHLQAGDPAAALTAVRQARALPLERDLTLSVHRLGGRAHLAAGEWELARRYLEKGLTGTRGAEREETLARLVIACRRLEETADAVRYRGLLKRPVTPEVEEILAERDPVLLAAGARKTPAAPVEPEPERVAPTPDRRARRPGPASLAADDQRLLVLPRSSWSPNPMRPNVELMDPIDKITIHHTGGDPCQDSSRSDAASTIRKIQRYHQRELHWADIGYHYIIDRNGSIWQGRPLRYQGAHAQGARNRGNIGIVVLGNFSRQEMTAAQQESLVALLTRLCDHFAIPASRVYTHREILQGKTACPGPALSRFVSEIRDDLRRRTIALGK